MPIVTERHVAGAVADSASSCFPTLSEADVKDGLKAQVDCGFPWPNPRPTSTLKDVVFRDI
jgi:hypothetical protein